MPDKAKIQKYNRAFLNTVHLNNSLYYTKGERLRAATGFCQVFETLASHRLETGRETLHKNNVVDMKSDFLEH